MDYIEYTTEEICRQVLLMTCYREVLLITTSKGGTDDDRHRDILLMTYVTIQCYSPI